MAGGLFGTHLTLNLKCLVFSAFVLIVYWMPHAKYWQHQVVIGFILAMMSYVLLAWYDVLYDCNDRLHPTFLAGFVMGVKPTQYRKEFDELPLKEKKLVRTVDIVILVILLGLAFSPYILYKH
jgi:hypothetical protein